ncbi:MAG: hypothetical protein Q4C72_05265 [Eubacteriales bacterium]|nr:hypothetical protein [Eubacteriales bacterium]
MSPTPDELRIRKALEEIETPMYDIAGAVGEQRARRTRRMPWRSPQRLLSAVLAAILLTATAAAVMQLSGGWQTIFGQYVVVPDDLAIPLQTGQTINGCTLTLEDAIITQSGAAVIYSFRREDGRPIGGSIRCGEVELLTDGSDESGGACGQSVYSDESANVQYYYQEFDLTNDPGDRALTLSVGPASRSESTGPLTAEIDLAAFYRSHPLTFSSDEVDEARAAAYAEQDCASAALPQADEFPGVGFAGVGFLDGELCLALTTPPDDPYQGVSADIVSVYDTRTGQNILNSSGSSYGASGLPYSLHEGRFPGLSEDDLPYLRPVITYTRSIPVTDRLWTFTFRAESAKSYTRALDLSSADGVRINTITVSPLGVQLGGTRPASGSMDGALPEIALVLRGGDTIGARVSGSTAFSEAGAPEEDFSASYEYLGVQHSRRFLDTEEVAAVRINNTTISIRE